MSNFPVPDWVKTVFLKHIPGWLCMCHIQRQYKDRGDETRDRGDINDPSDKVYLFSSANDTELTLFDRGDNAPPILPIKQRRPQNDAAKVLVSENNPTPHGLKVNRHAREKLQPETNYAKDWKNVAAVVDRLFFWIISFCIAILTVILFQPLIHGNKTRH